jgi:hypothetical protein
MASLATKRDTYKAQDFSASDKAVRRMRAGNDAGKSLKAAAMVASDSECEADGDTILEASLPQYIWHAERVEDAAGKVYDGFGSMIIPSVRSNPAYQKACSARARKTALKAINGYRKRALVGEDVRFITFTQPDSFGFDAAKAFALHRGAMVLLKKREWFREMVSVGVFSHELTTGANNTHAHVHTHSTAWTRDFKKPDIQTLRALWTDCLKKVARKLGKELPVNTKDGLANIQIKRVVPKGSRGKTLTEAIAETCKYSVKGVDFEKMSPEVRCQVERLLRNKHMLTTFRANNHKGSAKKGVARNAQYLDQPCTNDGDAPAPKIFDPCIMAKIWVCLVESVFGDGYDPKVESLRKYGARMIRADKRETWLKTLRAVYAARAEYRKIQLAERYPDAKFITLAGESFSSNAPDITRDNWEADFDAHMARYKVDDVCGIPVNPIGQERVNMARYQTG